MLALLAANSVSAQTFALPPAGEDLVGRIKVVGTRYQDTLSDVARAYDVGFDEIVRANPSVDHWLPGNGTRVIVPDWHILPRASCSIFPRCGFISTRCGNTPAGDRL